MSRHQPQVIRAVTGPLDRTSYDAFDEDRVRRDLACLANDPTLFGQYCDRIRIRFQRANERAVLEHWVKFFQTGERLIAAKTTMERRKSEYLQLAREHEIKETEKAATLAKLRADIEEHNLRFDKASYQRRHAELFGDCIASSAKSENAKAITEAEERRQLDTRWQLHESLRPLQTLIELQHWRREQRDRILQDRTLVTEEQTEDLQFVDDLYRRKHGELRDDTDIFEGRR